MTTDATQRVLDAIAAERARQDAKWGEQNHPSADVVLAGLVDKHARLARHHGVPTEQEAKDACDEAFRIGDGTWTHIAVEEMAEVVAAAADGPDPLRKELVQLAAVCVGWIECIDRRAKGGR